MGVDSFRTADELAGLLSPALGVDRAKAVVKTAAEGLGHHGALDRQAALDVLETIAKEPGLVGVTARFVKSRVILGG